MIVRADEGELLVLAGSIPVRSAPFSGPRLCDRCGIQIWPSGWSTEDGTQRSGLGKRSGGGIGHQLWRGVESPCYSQCRAVIAVRRLRRELIGQDR